MEVAAQQQQALTGIAPHLAPVAECEDLVLLSEGMNDGRALAIGVTQLRTPKVPRAQVAALLPDVARRARAAAQERGEREPDKGQAVATCALGFECLQRTSVQGAVRPGKARYLAMPTAMARGRKAPFEAAPVASACLACRDATGTAIPFDLGHRRGARLLVKRL